MGKGSRCVCRAGGKRIPLQSGKKGAPWHPLIKKKKRRDGEKGFLTVWDKGEGPKASREGRQKKEDGKAEPMLKERRKKKKEKRKAKAFFLRRDKDSPGPQNNWEEKREKKARIESM